MQWWDDKYIMRIITKRICGHPFDRIESSYIHYLKTNYKDRLPFENGLSNGCGEAAKEYLMVQSGIVERFSCYDIDNDRLNKAKRINGIDLICGDALKSEKRKFDFILWSSSLHHMPDVYKALQWTKNHLKNNGVILICEYCGVNRLGLKNTSKIKWHEALDSERIEQALTDVFKGIEIKPLGGAWYRKAIHGKGRYDSHDVMRKDDTLLRMGKYDYLFAVWENK